MFIVTRKEGEIQFSDTDFHYLQGVLNSLDSSLSDINEKIKNSDVCDVSGLCDHGEYLIGLGFCAMQRYFFSTLQDIEIEAHVARDLGSKSVLDKPVAKLIHAAANYWKHEPEWHIWLAELKPRSQKTIDEILHGREFADYPLSELLADLCGEKELLLSNCLPYLIEWRKAVWLYTTENV
ncbi:hypothetical protein PVK62_16440 [Aliivibrio sp. S3MY1]|nr:hypothetical protein [Aliivibrio sp. S3MY1]MDD9197418.1 hypothetical protein [Aliivibrio sp. S3MY1]